MIVPATSDHIAAMTDLLMAAHSSSPYAGLPVNRGRTTRMLAMLIPQGCCWVRIHRGDVVAAVVAQPVENLYGNLVLSVHAVVGEGGTWLLKRLVAQAKEKCAVGVWASTSSASNDGKFNSLVQALGGLRTGSTYEVQTWPQQSPQ